jgi:adenosylcobinamide-GDP ribazoletransferase
MRSGMGRLVASLKSYADAGIAAFQLLTRLPISVKLDYTPELFRRSVVFYPVVGLVLGVLLAVLGHMLERVLPAAPLAVLLTAFWVALTGALHVDGLMDTADGVLSHRSRERMLEIMKDSRVGAMGVVTGVLALMMKASLLYSVIGFGALVWYWLPLVLIWSRAGMVWAIVGWPYARPEGGMGRLVGSAGKREAILAILLAGVGTAWVVSLVSGSMSLLHTSLLSIGMIVGTGVMGWLVCTVLSRKLGGLTGDTYGALNELLEIGLLFWVIVVWNI